MTLLAHSTLLPILGGAIIGLAAILLMWSNGRILGVSGIAAALFARDTSARRMSICFLAGIIIAGIFGSAMRPALLPGAPAADTLTLIVAGIAVGFGTRLGNGCTSGHGVCGISRLSKRSFIATVTFMLTATLTVFFTHHVLG